MVRQDESAVEELSLALHDLLWVMPRTLDAAVERALGPLPATELEVMRLLARRPGLGVSDVASELGLQTSNASTAVRSLIARGLLRRQRDGDDARRVQLVLTARAGEIRRRREEAWAEALGRALARLSEQDARRLLQAAGPISALVATLAAAAEPNRTPADPSRTPAEPSRT